MPLDEFLERDAHLFLDSDRVVHVTTDAKEFGTSILGSSEPFEPRSSTSHDRGTDSNSLDIRHCRWAPVETSVGWKGRLQPGATWLALETLDQTCLFATNVCASSGVDIHIKVVATAASVLADEAFCVGLLHCLLKLVHFVPKLATHVDVSCLRTHGESNHKSAFNQLVRVVSQNLSVLASSGLRLVTVDYQVRWSVEEGECGQY
jgi:hypothetical protein